MNDHSRTRKPLRLKGHDYATAGAYFLTICTANRQPLLWTHVGAAISRPDEIPLSAAGQIVDTAIRQIPEIYPAVRLDKYCIMPDHVHMILFIDADEHGRQIAAPTVSTVIGQMKRWVSLQTGFPVWQKSFVDRIIRNEQAYLAVWEYIDNNPLRPDTGEDIFII